eukprot:TRINITY_DN1893_c0_g1_i1.p1 TRINITY_DN1893_c0_g1~~TRINITY_DN1893_c0_g1_i1.p1  ORF type:complete len:717 (-),score=190.22 TRINITY_DN1893_c0_g1_i1:41-2191(-)
MKSRFHFFSFILFFFFLFIIVNCKNKLPDADYMKDKMYYDIVGAFPCNALMGSMGKIGCYGNERGNEGWLYLIETQDDFNKFQKESFFLARMIVVMNSFTFTKSNVDWVLDRILVSGILVLEDAESQISEFSPADPYPNKQYGLYPNSTHSWNPNGNSWNFKGYDKPIFELDLENSKDIYEKAKYNQKHGFPKWTDAESQISEFSPADPYPNKQYGLYPNSTHSWNPNGNSWNFKGYDKPIFELDLENSKDIYEKAKYNQKHGFPKWAAELINPMYVDKDIDVETCLRRGHCDPLGGKNIWFTFNNMDLEENQQKELVVLAATLDSNAFFHDLATGAGADVSDMITVLSVINTINGIEDIRTQLEKEILFTLFDGESWGYIGSKAFVNDIYNFTCNDKDPSSDSCSNPYRRNLKFESINPEKIKYIIELNQVGVKQDEINNNKNLYIHHDETNSNSINEFREILENNGSYEELIINNSSISELPPSSLQTFLKKSSQFSGLVLSGFDKSYNNRYYHSRLDTIDNIDPDLICKTSSLIAQSLLDYSLTLNSTIDIHSVRSNCSLVNELLDCLANNYTCSLFNYIEGPTEGSVPRTSSYVSVYRHKKTTWNVNFAYDLISNWTSPCNKSHCRTVNYHEAFSPGFGVNHKGEYIVADPTEPIFVESVWNSQSITIYKMSDPLENLIIFVIGTIEFFVSIVLVIILKKLLPKYDFKFRYE